MKIMKDLTQKIRSKGRMDAESRWWLTELPAAVWVKAWLHPGEEETMQKWYAWWVKMKKEYEKRKMEEMRKAVRGFCTSSRNQQHGEEEHRS